MARQPGSKVARQQGSLASATKGKSTSDKKIEVSTPETLPVTPTVFPRQNNRRNQSLSNRQLEGGGWREFFSCHVHKFTVSTQAKTIQIVDQTDTKISTMVTRVRTVHSNDLSASSSDSNTRNSEGIARNVSDDEGGYAHEDADEDARVRINDTVLVSAEGSKRKGLVGTVMGLSEKKAYVLFEVGDIGVKQHPISSLTVRGSDGEFNIDEDEDEEERVRINDKVMVTAKGSDRKGDVGIVTRLSETKMSAYVKFERFTEEKRHPCGSLTVIERARKSDEDEDEEAEADEDEEERVRINDKVMVTAKGSDRKGDVGIVTRLSETKMSAYVKFERFAKEKRHPCGSLTVIERARKSDEDEDEEAEAEILLNEEVVVTAKGSERWNQAGIVTRFSKTKKSAYVRFPHLGTQRHPLSSLTPMRMFTLE